MYFLRLHRGIKQITIVRHFGGANQRITMKRNDKHNSPIMMLNQISMLALVQRVEYHMAAFHVTHGALISNTEYGIHLTHPRSCGIDDGFGADLISALRLIIEGQMPHM